MQVAALCSILAGLPVQSHRSSRCASTFGEYETQANGRQLVGSLNAVVKQFNVHIYSTFSYIMTCLKKSSLGFPKASHSMASGSGSASADPRAIVPSRLGSTHVLCAIFGSARTFCPTFTSSRRLFHHDCFVPAVIALYR
jgi:hypothetical protein